MKFIRWNKQSEWNRIASHDKWQRNKHKTTLVCRVCVTNIRTPFESMSSRYRRFEQASIEAQVRLRRTEAAKEKRKTSKENDWNQTTTRESTHTHPLPHSPTNGKQRIRISRLLTLRRNFVFQTYFYMKKLKKIRGAVKVSFGRSYDFHPGINFHSVTRLDVFFLLSFCYRLIWFGFISFVWYGRRKKSSLL